jgi:hypothetical protein
MRSAAVREYCAGKSSAAGPGRRASRVPGETNKAPLTQAPASGALI